MVAKVEIVGIWCGSHLFCFYLIVELLIAQSWSKWETPVEDISGLISLWRLGAPLLISGVFVGDLHYVDHCLGLPI